MLDATEFAADTADVDPGARCPRDTRVLDPAQPPRKEPLQWLLAILVGRYGMVEVGDILEPMLTDMLG